jgi:hypothetical protein
MRCGGQTWVGQRTELGSTSSRQAIARAPSHSRRGGACMSRDVEVRDRPGACGRLARGLCLAVTAVGSGARRRDRDRPGDPGRLADRLPPRLAGCLPGDQPAAGPPASAAQLASDHPGHRAHRRPQRGRADPGNDRLHRRPGLRGSDRGPRRRQWLHRRNPDGGRGVRRRHRPAGPLHQRTPSWQEPRSQHRPGGRGNGAGDQS